MFVHWAELKSSCCFWKEETDPILSLFQFPFLERRNRPHSVPLPIPLGWSLRTPVVFVEMILLSHKSYPYASKNFAPQQRYYRKMMPYVRHANVLRSVSIARAGVYSSSSV